MCDAAQPEGRKDNAMYLDLRSLTTSAQCVAWTPILPNTHLTYRWVVGGNSPLISLNDIILWRNHTRYRSIITLTAHRNKQTSEYLSDHAHSPLSSLNNFLARKIIEIIDWLLRAQILKGYLIKSTNFLSDISFVNGMACRGNFYIFFFFPTYFFKRKNSSQSKPGWRGPTSAGLLSSAVRSPSDLRFCLPTPALEYPEADQINTKSN